MAPAPAQIAASGDRVRCRNVTVITATSSTDAASSRLTTPSAPRAPTGVNRNRAMS